MLHKTHLLTITASLACLISGALAQSSVVGWGAHNFDSANLLSPYVQLEAGTNHGLGLRADGSVQTWGDYSADQGEVPALPPGLTYVELSAGGGGTYFSFQGPAYRYGFSVARRNDGSVVAWGDNTSGQCDVPALPPGLTYVEIASGSLHTLARLSDGSVVAWGSNSSGQCDVPPLPPGLSYVAISAGGHPQTALWGEDCWGGTGNYYSTTQAGFSAALRSDGSVVAWGANNDGQCDVPVLPPGLTYVEISLGSEHSVARRSDGSVIAWGSNADGQCDVPDLSFGLTYVEVDAGAGHTLARRSDGSVVAWGDNTVGQCDVPALPAGLTYLEVEAGGLTWDVDGGPVCTLPWHSNVGFSSARRSDGAIVEWGAYQWQVRVPELAGGSTFAEIDSCGGQVVARISDGSIVQWGVVVDPVPLLPPGLSYVEVAAGMRHVVARRSDGSVVAWGNNSSGQCDVPALPPALAYVEVATSGQSSWPMSPAHTVARRSDGSVVAWGWNDWGQCDVPALPPGLTYVEIAAGVAHTVARRSDGSVMAWGANWQGQCDVPALPSGLTYVEIAAGSDFTVARRSDGSVVAWGRNTDGQCDVPALPPGLAYVQIAAVHGDGSYSAHLDQGHTVARRSDGAVVAWGDNSSGQCDVPALPAGFSYVEIAAGDVLTVARVENSPPCGSVSSYCGPPAANSVSAAGAQFVVSGCPGLTVNDLVFEVSGLPPNNSGQFFYSAQQTQLPMGNGTLCVGGTQQRVLPPMISSAAGTVQYQVDLNLAPFGIGPFEITPGSSWNFQYWYRDPAGGGASFNLSDAKHLVFAP